MEIQAVKSDIFLCSPKKFEGVFSLPTIEFKLIANELNLNEIDTILFSSKQAVIFANKLNPAWKERFIIAVGPATAKMAKELGAKEIYYPKNYYGKELAKDVLKYFQKKKILYIRPKIISFDSKTFLQRHGIFIKEAIIYETICKKYKNFSLPKNVIIIFTSPSTIECFFKSFEWDESFKAVVIGKSTLKKLPQNINAFVAKEPTIDACVELAKSLQ